MQKRLLQSGRIGNPGMSLCLVVCQCLSDPDCFADQNIQILKAGPVIADRHSECVFSVQRGVGDHRDALFLKPQHELHIERLEGGGGTGAGVKSEADYTAAGGGAATSSCRWALISPARYCA